MWLQKHLHPFNAQGEFTWLHWICSCYTLAGHDEFGGAKRRVIAVEGLVSLLDYRNDFMCVTKGFLRVRLSIILQN